MQSKQSLIHKPLIKSMKKKYKNLSNFSLVIICFMIVVDFFSNASFSYILTGTYVFLNIILATIYASQVQGHMVSPSQANYLASFPIESKTMWYSQYLAGLQLVLYPILIESFWIGFSLLLATHSIGRGSIITVVMFVSVVLAWIYYSFSFMICCMSQNKVSQIVNTLSITLLPVVLFYCLCLVSDLLLMGTRGVVNFDGLSYFAPVIGAINCVTNYITYETFEFTNLFTYIVLACLSIFVSYVIFKSSKIEDAGKAVSSRIIESAVRGLVSVTVACIVLLGVFYLGALETYQGITNIAMGIAIVVGIAVLVGLEIKLPSKSKILSIIMCAAFFFAGAKFVEYQMNYVYDCFITLGSGTNVISIDLEIVNNNASNYVSLSNEHVEYLDEFLEEHSDQVYINQVEGSVILNSCIYIMQDAYLYGNEKCSYYIEEDLLEQFYKEDWLNELVTDRFRLSPVSEDTIIHDYTTGWNSSIMTILDVETMNKLVEFTNGEDYSYFQEFTKLGVLDNSESFFITPEIYDFIKENQDEDFILAAMNYESYLEDLDIIGWPSLSTYCEKQNIPVITYSSQEELEAAEVVDISDGLFSRIMFGDQTDSILVVFGIDSGKITEIVSVGKVG